jgi:hypothetical protein
MAINLQSVIAAIEAKAAAADSTTPISDLYKIIIEANEVGIPMAVYDSAGVMPIDSAYVGSAFSTSAGGLYTLDSAGGSWQTADGSPPLIPYIFGGTISGYTSGGSAPAAINVIDKFPFAADANATDVGDLTAVRYGTAGQSSRENGYTAGGWNNGNNNVIDKFPFAADANATDVGDLTSQRSYLTGQSSAENGYSSGGAAPPSASTTVAVIDKFPFASDANATNAGQLTIQRQGVSGQSSTEYGYTSGGYANALSNVIDKFPFAVDANATSVGTLSVARDAPSGQSSAVSGYNSGGTVPGVGYLNVIDKFPFASDASATDVGDLTVTRSFSAGQSSTENGYVSGGIPNDTAGNVIDKFPFASDANATDIGNLTVIRSYVSGQHV